MTEKDFTLLNVIKVLGPSLTAEEGDHRSRGKLYSGGPWGFHAEAILSGVELLSSILEKCPPERLDKHSSTPFISLPADL